MSVCHRLDSTELAEVCQCARELSSNVGLPNRRLERKVHTGNRNGSWPRPTLTKPVAHGGSFSGNRNRYSIATDASGMPLTEPLVIGYFRKWQS